MAAGFSNAAGVCATTQAVVLTTIVRKLQSEILEFAHEGRCFLSDAPEPGTALQEPLFCTVAPAEGAFHSHPPAGAGPAGIVESSSVRVTLWSRVLLDRLEHSVTSWTDSTRGLLVLKQRVLAVLAGSQLYADFPLTNQPLLVEALAPVRSLHPAPVRGPDAFQSLVLVFQATFAWQLH